MLRLVIAMLLGCCGGVWAVDPQNLEAARAVTVTETVHSADSVNIQWPFSALPKNKIQVPHTIPPQTVAAQLWILVSFSLNDASLRSLYQQSRIVHAHLVFRGVPAAGLVGMQQRLQHLGIEAEVDPWWFRQYQVQQVPAFILTVPVFHRGKNQPGDAVVLLGLLDVQSALEWIRRNTGRPAARHAAEQLLEQWPHV